MRIAKVASYYGAYVRSFYRTHPGLARRSYKEQLAALLADCFSWADFYDAPLEKLGYQIIEIIRDAEPLQRRWAREHGLAADLSLEEITARQISDVRPDVLWFEDSSDGPPAILRYLEEAGLRPSLVLGWTGSFLPQTDAYRKVDLTLSCAPESVEYLRARGAAVEHLDHAFSPIVLRRMRIPAIRQDLAFFGHIHRSEGFHRERAKVLESIVATGKRIRIYTPQLVAGTADPFHLSLRTVKSLALYPAKLGVYATTRALAAIGAPPHVLSGNRLFRRALELGEPPKPLPPPNDLPPELLEYSARAVFGLDMYTAIAGSRIVLNVHADSSPHFASNMRLFEVTGAGSLLLTDWRENLPMLFEPDFEVVAYRSVEECLEKITWLTDHKEARARIAAAGRARCLRDHTFEVRAARLHEIIHRRMR
jgi:spore maturation protein CgeB